MLTYIMDLRPPTHYTEPQQTLTSTKQHTYIHRPRLRPRAHATHHRYIPPALSGIHTDVWFQQVERTAPVAEGNISH
jgi:hypothetical protein